jgi:hypothetical protein
MLTLKERQAALIAKWKAEAEETARRKTNARGRVLYRKNKTKPWHGLRTAAAEKRRGIEERKAARLAKKKVKEEKRRLREQARKRKLKDPIAEAARIFAEAYAAGQRSIIEGGIYIKKP